MVVRSKLAYFSDITIPPPLVGEGGSPQSGETGEGSLSARTFAVEFAEATPHPALRATFSHKGRREKSRGSRGEPLAIAAGDRQRHDAADAFARNCHRQIVLGPPLTVALDQHLARCADLGI